MKFKIYYTCNNIAEEETTVTTGELITMWFGFGMY